MSVLKVGNGAGFWGDDITAPARLLSQAPHLHYLTLDYLAEVSLSIMAIQKEKNPTLGYAQDCLEVIETLIPLWKQGNTCKLISNGGGLNPKALAEECKKLLKKHDLSLKVFYLEGDNVLKNLKEQIEDPLFVHLDKKRLLKEIADKLVTANAYLGAEGIVEALQQGADIIITGRVADPSMTVAPAMFHYEWTKNNYQAIAGATVAGHLIECGTQVTGGITTDWLEIPHTKIGFPIVEIDNSGNCVITKSTSSGGKVNLQTVKEQLLYEIGDPSNYLSPDVTVSFLELKVKEDYQDRIQVSNARGKAPTDTYKVSATYRAGYKAEGYLTIFGENAILKAKKAGEALMQHLQTEYSYQDTLIEVIGDSAILPGKFSNSQAKECVLRVAVRDENREAVEFFTKEIAPLVTAGPQGTTGYLSGRPTVRPVFGYWPCLIKKSAISLKVTEVK